jgi:hypothetical protein
MSYLLESETCVWSKMCRRPAADLERNEGALERNAQMAVTGFAPPAQRFVQYARGGGG